VKRTREEKKLLRRAVEKAQKMPFSKGKKEIKKLGRERKRIL